MMTQRQKDAYKNYEAWCDNDWPEVSLADTLRLAIGSLVNYTDGCPDPDEMALFRLYTLKLRQLEESKKEEWESA